LEVPKKKGHSLLRPSQMVRSRIDKVHAEQGKRTYDETLTMLQQRQQGLQGGRKCWCPLRFIFWMLILMLWKHKSLADNDPIPPPKKYAA